MSFLHLLSTCQKLNGVHFLIFLVYEDSDILIKYHLNHFKERSRRNMSYLEGKKSVQVSLGFYSISVMAPKECHLLDLLLSH